MVCDNGGNARPMALNEVHGLVSEQLQIQVLRWRRIHQRCKDRDQSASVGRASKISLASPSICAPRPTAQALRMAERLPKIYWAKASKFEPFQAKVKEQLKYAFAWWRRQSPPRHLLHRKYENRYLWGLIRLCQNTIGHSQIVLQKMAVGLQKTGISQPAIQPDVPSAAWMEARDSASRSGRNAKSTHFSKARASRITEVKSFKSPFPQGHT